MSVQHLRQTRTHGSSLMCEQEAYFYSARRVERPDQDIAERKRTHAAAYRWAVCISSLQVSLKPNWLCVSVCDIQPQHTQLVFQVWLSLGGEKMVRNSALPEDRSSCERRFNKQRVSDHLLNEKLKSCSTANSADHLLPLQSFLSCDPVNVWQTTKEKDDDNNKILFTITSFCCSTQTGSQTEFNRNT